jgi:toxin ParE1/3/4
MKKYNVLFDVDTEDDLFDIYRYIALNDSIECADKLYTTLKKACDKLKLFPHRGNVPLELFEIGVVEFREIRNKPYRILYSIESTSVLVHCILDGRRDIQTILQERLLR